MVLSLTGRPASIKRPGLASHCGSIVDMLIEVLDHRNYRSICIWYPVVLKTIELRLHLDLFETKYF